MKVTLGQSLKWTSMLAAAMALFGLGALALQVRSGQDLVLLRNALIAEVGPAHAYQWTPDSVPEDFEVERLATPDSVQSFVDQTIALTGPSSDLDKAIRLAAALSHKKTRGLGPIQSDTVSALRQITVKGSGYCADYTQVFNALAPAAGLAVREWGMSFDGYGGDGHAFNEVWDRGLGKWVFIDSFFSFYVTDLNGRPLSAVEFREALLHGSADQIVVIPINAQKFGFKSAERALDYYHRGAERFFIVWGNNVLTYDAAPVVKVLGRLSRSAEQAGAIAAGIQPRLLIPEDFADPAAVDELFRLRALLLMSGSSFFIALASLLLLRVFRK